MKRLLLLPLLLLTTALFYGNTSILASTSDVSASVPSSSSTIYAPNLIAPANNSSTNSALLSFVWKRPSPPDSSTLDHYDLFIDDAIFANNIPDSLTSQDFYFYTASASSDIFYIGLKQEQAQGYHTWRVAVYDNLGQNTATGNWTYYIDSIPPFISLNKIENTTYSWNTAVSGSIPDETSRYISTISNSPKLSGQVETNSNFLFSLICPTNAPSTCNNQSWSSNSTSGNWEQQLTNLTNGVTYTVSLSATDATNNTTIFPSFYLTYQTTPLSPTTKLTVTKAPTPAITATPTPISTPSATLTPLPPATTTLTPPPELGALVTPTPFTPKAPPAPTLPPQRKQAAVVEGQSLLQIFLIILLIIGLPLHLILSAFSLNIKAKNLIKFLLIYGYPFLSGKNSTSKPFVQIEIYNQGDLTKPIFDIISDIKGHYNTPKKLPNQILIRTNAVGYQTKNQIIKKNILISSCLNPEKKKVTTNKEKVQTFIYQNLKIIPLIIAICSSAVGIVIFKNLYIILYFYFSAQYTYSEYFYNTKIR